MPTHDRRAFVPRAIEYFLRQDYPNLELVILDDGGDKVADLVPERDSLRYLALPHRLRLGAKRNSAIEASRGDIILHWDDDDWSDPARVSTQVAALLAGEADICGTSQVWFCEIASGRLSVYRYPPSQRGWLYGASLCYRRSLWRRKPFQELDNGEDTRFVWAPPQGRMLDLRAARLLIAMVHGRNISAPRPLSGPNWQLWPEHARVPLGSDWAFYESLAKRLPNRSGYSRRWPRSRLTRHPASNCCCYRTAPTWPRARPWAGSPVSRDRPAKCRLVPPPASTGLHGPPRPGRWSCWKAALSYHPAGWTSCWRP
jgi:glycosyltransferase involved in cell wall biosynthesis